MGNYIKAIKLLKNRLYPTYQLHAYMANKKTTPKDGLKIAMLTVLEWIRDRLEEPIPPELKLPDPAAYAQVPLEAFQSVHINYGYLFPCRIMGFGPYRLRNLIWVLSPVIPGKSVNQYPAAS